MLRSHDDAVTYLGFGKAGEGSGKVKDELASGVGNDCQVGIGNLCGLGIQLYTQLILRFGLIVVHRIVLIFCKFNKFY